MATTKISESTLVKYGSAPSKPVPRAAAPTASAPAPRAPDPALVAPAVVGQFTSLKIPVAAADAGIEVTVPRWPTMAASQRIYITWDGNATANRVPTTPPFYSVTAADVANPGFSWTVRVPASYTAAEGTHVVSYMVTTVTGLNATWPTAGTTVIVDRTAPGGELLPILLGDDEQQLPPTLTSSSLISDQFVTTVSDYDGIEINDVLTPWIQGASDPAPVRLAGSAETVDADEVHTRKVKLRFERADIEDRGDGLLSFGYSIVDEPGNQSIDSPAARIRVILLDVPSQLLAPVVPAYRGGGGTNDGVVSYSDAVQGVDVQVPAYVTPHVGDIVVIDWGGQKSAPYALVAGDITQDPVTTIKMLFPAVAAAGSNPALPVAYTIERDGQTYSSPALNVNVDLSVPGGPDPQASLRQIVIESVTGVVDSIPKDDFGLNATAIINNRTNQTPAQPAYVAGDIIIVTWGGVDIAPPYTVQTGDNAQPLRLPIAGRYIDTSGNIPVNYRISRELQPPYTPPVREEGAPLPKTIPVESDQGKPGDGQPFPGPTFPDAPDDYIDREIAAGPVRVRCQVALANIIAQDTVELTLQGLDLALVPIPTLPDETMSHQISAEELAAGFYDFVIPREFLRKICQGWLRTTFKLTNSVGSGISDPTEIIVDLSNTENPSCET